MEAKGDALANHYAKQVMLPKITILSKPSKDKSLERFKVDITKYQCLAPDVEKNE